VQTGPPGYTRGMGRLEFCVALACSRGQGIDLGPFLNELKQSLA